MRRLRAAGVAAALLLALAAPVATARADLIVDGQTKPHGPRPVPQHINKPVGRPSTVPSAASATTPATGPAGAPSALVLGGGGVAVLVVAAGVALVVIRRRGPGDPRP